MPYDWISVKESLPEDGQRVDVKGLISGTKDISILRGIHYWDTVGFISNITHWKPHAS